MQMNEPIKWLRKLWSSSPVSDVTELPDDFLTQAIISYLDTTDPSTAFMVSGEWGVGKTFHLKTRKARIEEKSRKKLLFMSLAGLSSRAEIDRELFVASAEWTKSGYAKAANIFVKAGMRAVNIQPEDFKFTADLRSGAVALVLDDADRFGGDFRVIAGFLIDLLDQSRIHTIVIASERRWDDSSHYGPWKERIVGTTIRVVPDKERMFDEFVKALPDRQARTVILRHREVLGRLVNEWGLGNLRSLQYAVQELGRVAKIGETRLAALGYFEETLLCGLFVGLLETKRDARTADAVGQIFSHQGLSEAAQASLAGIRMSNDLEDEQAHQVGELIGRYPSFEFSLFPGGRVFADYFDFGIVDNDGFISAFPPSAVAESRRAIFLKDYLRLSQKDFDAEFQSIITELKASAIRSTEALAQIYLALRGLANASIISMSVEDLSGLVSDSINRLDPDLVVDWDSDKDPFWFMESKSNADLIVEKSIIDKRRASRSAKSAQERRSVFNDFVGGDAFAKRLQEWQLRPLFVGDARELADSILKLDPSSLRDIIRLFGSRSRISGVEGYLADERDTLLQIADMLRNSPFVGSSNTLKLSQLDKLAEAMTVFSEKLGRVLQ